MTISDDVVALYEALPRDAMRKLLLLEYRCGAATRSHLLLHVWQMPGGRFWYKPKYDLSPRIADAESTPRAQETKTTDGFRKWPATGGSLDDFLEIGARSAFALPLECDHYRNLAVSAAQIEEDLASTPGNPRPILWPRPDTPGR